MLRESQDAFILKRTSLGRIARLWAQVKEGLRKSCLLAFKRLAEMSDSVCVVADSAHDAFAEEKLGNPSDSVYYMDHGLCTQSAA